MMSTTTMWFLSLSAAVIVVLVYELLFVYVHRARQKKLEERAETMAQTLDSAAAMLREIIEAEQTTRQEIRALEASVAQLQPRSDATLYAHAISLAAEGAEPERLRTCFGLAPGEAHLLSLLHGGKHERRPAA